MMSNGIKGHRIKPSTPPHLYKSRRHKCASTYRHTRPRPILPQFIPNLMYLCSEYNLADLSYQSVESISTKKEIISAYLKLHTQQKNVQYFH